MPYPLSPYLVLLATVVLGAGASKLLFSLFAPDVLETQTHFAISQIVQQLDGIKEPGIPQTNADLIEFLKSSKIDWNSCRIQQNGILDGWGRPVTMVFDQVAKKWTFHSSGKDGTNGTKDDIERSTSGSHGGGQ